MTGNPEFRRHLWLELTPHRLVGMPAVLAGIFYLAYLSGRLQGGSQVSYVAMGVFVALAYLWGTRQATESVLTEIRDRTWDWQRLSAIDPWALTWGKLFGSTVYTWYGGLICLVVYGVTATDVPAAQVLKTIALLACGALFCHSLGLLSSLQAIAKERRPPRSFSSAFLILALFVVFPLIQAAFQNGTVPWYGHDVATIDFILGSLVCFTTWTVVGVYCLIRAELKFRTPPLAWPAFTLFFMVWTGGVAAGGKNESAGLLAAFVAACGLTYLMIFLERKDPVAFRRLLQAVDSGPRQRLLAQLPCWALTLPFVLAAAALLLLFPPQLAGNAPLWTSRALVVTMTAFVGRDVSLVLFLNLGDRPKRADLIALLWLLLLYGLIPAIVNLLGFDPATALFWPSTGHPLVSVVAALAQMAGGWGLTLRRWQQRHAVVVRQAAAAAG